LVVLLLLLLLLLQCAAVESDITGTHDSLLLLLTPKGLPSDVRTNKPSANPGVIGQMHRSLATQT
jgi:hypothetical protein